LIAAFLTMISPPLMADEVEAKLINTIDTASFPSPDPAGIVYLPIQDAFLISDSEINEMNIFQGANVFKVDRYGNLLETFSTLQFSDEPTGITINSENNHCFFSDDTGDKSIIEVDSGDDGLCLTEDDNVTGLIRANHFGSTNPEDVTYGLDSLFTVDALQNKVYRIMRGANALFDDAQGDDLVSSFDTEELGLDAPTGIVFDSADNSLYIVGGHSDLIIQTSVNGDLLRTIDISAVNAKSAAGLALAPGSEDSSITNLYMVARGEDNDDISDENDGKLYELSISSLLIPEEGETPELYVLQRRVSASTDDAEERANGSMYINSSDLELVFDYDLQTVGIRFTNLTLPENAIINKAYIQFSVDETDFIPDTLLNITAESTANAAGFNNTDYNISRRTRTKASASWAPQEWDTSGATGTDQRSPDLSAIVQEIVSETLWNSGNAMAFILTGVGRRVAEAYDGDPAGAPLLYVEYRDRVGSLPDDEIDSVPPVIAFISPVDGAVISGIINLEVEASDDSGVASVQYQWDSQNIGDPVSEAPFNLIWDTAEIGDEFVTLTAIATDLAGNTTVSNFAVVQIVNEVSTPDPSTPPLPLPDEGERLNVPEQYPTIQEAVDVAKAGDVIIIAPGTYTGGIKISSSGITMASRFILSNNASDVKNTIIRGGAPVILIDGSAGNTRIIGLTILNGTKGVQCYVFCDVLDNIFDNVGADAMSLERAGGNIIGNTFTASGDDAIDLDGPENTLISGNTIKGSKDDGIEIRNFDYSGEVIKVVIRDNSIDNSGEDGLQLIDYPANSNRIFTFANNLITTSEDAGIGLMAGGVTSEDLTAASVPERVYVFNNTIVGNKVGLSGGDNLVAVNNIFVNSSIYAIKGVNGKSIAAYNLYYNTQGNIFNSNIMQGTMLTADPKFGSGYQLQSGSPAIDRGTRTFVFDGKTVLNITDFLGENPDLGSIESE
ncbi:MAG TPA: right-handed parallel beta-helix repeat-containing protein, partial [Psychromonas sp.]